MASLVLAHFREYTVASSNMLHVVQMHPKKHSSYQAVLHTEMEFGILSNIPITNKYLLIPITNPVSLCSNFLPLSTYFDCFTGILFFLVSGIHSGILPIANTDILADIANI